MSEPITSAISDRICQHMNEDHSEAITLSAQIAGEVVPVRVEFNHTLKDAQDAHHTLIAMIKQARNS